MLFNRNTSNSNADDALKGNRPDILRQLDEEFNTADTANRGILGGILEEQFEEARAYDEFKNRGQQDSEPSEPAQTQRPAARQTEAADFEKFYQPLNSSIQDLRTHYERQADDLRTEIRELRQELGRNAQQAQPAAPQYDPNEYATHGHLQPFEQRQSGFERHLWNMGLRLEHQRAQQEFLMFKQQYPDSTLTLDEVNSTFRKFVGQDYNRAVNIDWRGVFSTNYAQSMAASAPSLREENARLKAENEQLKKGGARATQARQTQPQNAASEIQAVSPALRPSGRAIASAAASDSGNDVINLPSFRKGKSFKNYGRELHRGGFIGGNR